MPCITLLYFVFFCVSVSYKGDFRVIEITRAIHPKKSNDGNKKVPWSIKKVLIKKLNDRIDDQKGANKNQ
jgi:hypothetical protein